MLNYDDLFYPDLVQGLPDPMGTRARKVAGYAGAYASDGLDAAKGMAQVAPGAAWQGIGKYGRAGVIGAGIAGAGYLGTRYIASPIVGANIDPERKESIGSSGVGQFLTGWNPDSPALQEKILEKKEGEYYDKNRERINDERAYLEDAYRRKAEYDTDLAYRTAVNQTGLGLAAGGAQRARDVYAAGLSSEVDNYLKSLQIANQGVANIMRYQVQPI